MRRDTCVEKVVEDLVLQKEATIVDVESGEGAASPRFLLGDLLLRGLGMLDVVV